MPMANRSTRRNIKRESGNSGKEKKALPALPSLLRPPLQKQSLAVPPKPQKRNHTPLRCSTTFLPPQDAGIAKTSLLHPPLTPPTQTHYSRPPSDPVRCGPPPVLAALVVLVSIVPSIPTTLPLSTTHNFRSRTSLNMPMPPRVYLSTPNSCLSLILGLAWEADRLFSSLERPTSLINNFNNSFPSPIPAPST